jgi:hypothetical protein
MLLGYYLLGFSDTKQYVFFKNNKYNCFTNRISSTDKFIIDLTGFNEEKDFVFILDKPSQSARNVPLLELLKSNDLISIEKAKYKDAYEIP